MLLKTCRCGRVIPYGMKACEACAAVKRDTKVYDKKRDERIVRFRNSALWHKCRDAAMVRDNYQCQRCKAKGIIRAAQEVHHIVPIAVAWDKRVEMNNLVSLCIECHKVMEAQVR